jgi:hypothetical protein
MPYRYDFGLIDPTLWANPLVAEYQGYLLASYTMNGWLRAPITDPHVLMIARQFRPHQYYPRDSAIARPSMTPIFGDGQTGEAIPETDSSALRDLYWQDGGSLLAMRYFTLARHGRSGPVRSSMPVAPGEPLGPWFNNLACFDGHVERVKLDDLWKFYWHKEWVPPTVRPP